MVWGLGSARRPGERELTAADKATRAGVRLPPSPSQLCLCLLTHRPVTTPLSLRPLFCARAVTTASLSPVIVRMNQEPTTNTAFLGRKLNAHS